MKGTIVLGINAYHGDVSAVLVRDGELVAAVEEERFRRIKHVAGFPSEAIRACLGWAGSGHRMSITSASRATRARICCARRGSPFAIVRVGGLSLIAHRTTGVSARFPTRVAHVLGLSASVGGRRCTGSSITRRTWQARSSCRRSKRPPCAPSTASATSSARRGRWVAAARSTSSTAPSSRTRWGSCIWRSRSTSGSSKFGDEFKVMGLAPYGKPGLRGRDSSPRARCCPRHVRAGPGVLPALVRRRGDDVGRWASRRSVAVFTSRARGVAGARAALRRAAHRRVTKRLPHRCRWCSRTPPFHVLNGLHAATRLASAVPGRRLRHEQRRERKDPRRARRSRRSTSSPRQATTERRSGPPIYVWNQVLAQPRRFVMQHGYWGPSFDRPAIDAQRIAERARRDLEKLRCRSRTFDDAVGAV